MLRVLTVDDSAFMRKLISQMVEDSQIAHMVATARNGIDALKKIEQFELDVITLDLEMPEMDGIQTLKHIKAKYDIPVIILSGYAEKNGSRTLDALELGAVDFIQKCDLNDPSGVDRMTRELAEKLAAVRALGHNPNPLGGPHRTFGLETQKRPKALVIGTSTGGPRALMRLAAGLKGVPDFPIFVVQHMPRGFTKSLANRLNEHSLLEVCEARDGMVPQKGVMYLAPGDYHMRLIDERLRLDRAEKIYGVRPAVDYLFTTAAVNYKDELLACILTGMGKDGTQGLGEVKKHGGYVIAQDEASSTVFGMPKTAIEAQVVDLVLSLTEIIDYLNELV